MVEELSWDGIRGRLFESSFDSASEFPIVFAVSFECDIKGPDHLRSRW